MYNKGYGPVFYIFTNPLNLFRNEYENIFSQENYKRNVKKMINLYKFNSIVLLIFKCTNY